MSEESEVMSFAERLGSCARRLERQREALATNLATRAELLDEILALHREARELEAQRQGAVTRGAEGDLACGHAALRELHRDLAGLSLGFQCAAYAQLPPDQRQTLVGLALASIEDAGVGCDVIAPHRRASSRVRSPAN